MATAPKTSASEAIAHASGGMFGIGAVPADERRALEQIAAKLKNR